MQTTKWGNKTYCAVAVLSRGFANERSVYVADANDADAVARLQALVDVERIPGTVTDSYDAYWMDTEAIQSHLAVCGGMVMTIMPDGERDAVPI